MACTNQWSFKNLLLLFKYGVDPLLVHDITKRNALHYACISGYKPCIRELINRKVSLTDKDFAGKTPCDIAKEHRHYGILAMVAESLEEDEVQRVFKDVDYKLMKKFIDERKQRYLT